MTAPVSKHHLIPVLPAAFSPAPIDFAAAPTAGFGTLFRRAIDAVAGLWLRASVMNELRGLTDHELADIGLSRGDLHRVFDPAFAAEYGRRG